jgi:hypothetical protein
LVRISQDTVGRREDTANDDCVGEGAAMVKTDADVRKKFNLVRRTAPGPSSEKSPEFRDVLVADKLLKPRV